MARERMNAPMKRNISGSAKGAKTSLAGATPSTTQTAAPNNAVTGSGRASVTHSTTTAPRTAARRCAAGVTPVIGRARKQQKDSRSEGCSDAPADGRAVRRTGVQLVDHTKKPPPPNSSLGLLYLMRNFRLSTYCLSILPSARPPPGCFFRRSRSGVICKLTRLFLAP